MFLRLWLKLKWKIYLKKRYDLPRGNIAEWYAISFATWIISRFVLIVIFIGDREWKTWERIRNIMSGFRFTV